MMLGVIEVKTKIGGQAVKLASREGVSAVNHNIQGWGADLRFSGNMQPMKSRHILKSRINI